MFTALACVLKWTEDFRKSAYATSLLTRPGDCNVFESNLIPIGKRSVLPGATGEFVRACRTFLHTRTGDNDSA